MKKIKLDHELGNIISRLYRNHSNRFCGLFHLFKISSQLIVSEKKTGLVWTPHIKKKSDRIPDVLRPYYSNGNDPTVCATTNAEFAGNHQQLTEMINKTEKKVPTNNAVRLINVGNLALKILFGSVKEAYHDYRQGNAFSVKGKLLANENLDSVNQTVRLLRGVALKLAQIIDLHNISIPFELSNALSDAKKNAFAIPRSQVCKLMESELGVDWREHFNSFCDLPFAAASIGQVHNGILKGGKPVAVKIQYPNIEKTILSDLNLLDFINNHLRIFPRGLYMNKLLAELRKELISECDYEKELLFLDYYKEKIIPTMNIYNLKLNFYVPNVYKHLSTKKVLTTENMNSENTTEISALFQDKKKSRFDFMNNAGLRNSIAESLLYLTLHELFIFRTLQTDPNPANFLVDLKNKRIILLDFGATRSYSKEFVEDYVNMIKLAISGSDTDIIKQFIKMKFILGTENEGYIKLHINAIKMVSEIFKPSPSPFNFSKSEIVQNISNIIPNILLERETPPLSEIYSLHRRIAGFFVICNRLGAEIDSHKIFTQVLEKYES